MKTRAQRKLVILGGILLVASGVLATSWYIFDTREPAPRASVTIERGLVERTVNVSGTMQSDATAALAFPVTGTLATLLVTEGDQVVTGQALAQLRTHGTEQELQEARASLAEAIAQQQELLRGVTTETREVTNTLVRNAEQQQARVVAEQTLAIQNARQTLLSTDLVAFPTDPQERTTAPTISGTYRCDSEGSYRFTVFRSAAESGFSIRVSGLETDTIPLSFTQAVPFGTCGLRARFIESVYYNNTTWDIAVPNTASPQYITNRNQYNSVVLAANNAITQAEDAVTLARQQRDRDIAPTRSEQISQATARISQIEARIDRIQTRLDEHTLRAPFPGIITNTAAVAGEVVGPNPIITLLGTTDADELRIRVPEIDITNLAVGQSAQITFDARRSEPQTGSVAYLSPLSVQVDGVAYFEATIQLDTQPHWLRSGLNADVDLVTESRSDALRIPTTLLIHEGTDTFVQTGVQNGDRTAVTVELQGTNGYTAITGVAEHTTIYAPK